MEKLYYRISEVAKMLNETEVVIRTWSNQFCDYVKPKRNERGVRMYSSDDIDQLRVIRMLIRDEKLTSSGAMQKLRHNATTDEFKKLKIKESLNTIKKVLLNIREEL